MTISTSNYVAINIGSTANDGTGDNLRTAFNKLNQNFANWQAVGIPTQNVVASGVVQATYLIGDGSNISNVGIGATYSNVNCAAYLSSVNIVPYSNVNVAAYLTSQNITSYSNVQVNAFLPTYSGNLLNIQTSGNIVGGGNISAQGIVANTLTVDNLFVTYSLDASVNGSEIGYLNMIQNNNGSGDYVLQGGDRGKHVLMTPSVLANVYIEDQVRSPWPVGSIITIVNHGAGNTNVQANAGVTLWSAGNSITGSNSRIVTSHSVATLLNIQGNVWYIYGTTIV